SWYRPGAVWRATADRLGARTASGVSVTQAVGDSHARVGQPPSGIVVVRQSQSLRDGSLGGLTALLALALFDDLRDPGTNSDRLDAGVFIGLLVVAAAVGWWRALRRKSRVEVSPDRLRFVGNSSRPHPDLIRDQGDELVMYRRRVYGLIVEQ